MNKHEPFPNPNEFYFEYDRMRIVRLRCLKRIEQELTRFLRNQSITNDLKRQCGVSTSEGK